MAIGFRTSSSADIAAMTTTVTVTKPTGTASTDVLVYVFGSDNATSASTTITPPSGVTRIGVKVLGSSGVNRINLDAFVCLGSQSSLGFTNSISGGGFQQGWVGLAFTGVDNTTPIDVADGTGNSGTGATTLTVNGVTVATDQAWDCVACCDWLGGVLSGTGFAVVENGHTNASAAMLYNTTPKSTGATGTMTLSDGASATGQILTALRFALRPAAGGATETYPAGHSRQWQNPLIRMHHLERTYGLDLSSDGTAPGRRSADRRWGVGRLGGPVACVALGTGQRSRRARAARRRLEAAGHGRP